MYSRSVTSIASSVEWLVTLVTGTLATGLMTLAVAIIGYRMLAGQSSIRQGAYALIGSFVLIGSAYMARSLVEVLPRVEAAPPPPAPVEAPRDLPEVVPDPPRQRGNPFDPYSGNEPVN